MIGTLSHPVSTRNKLAQQYFNQGLTFFYGFDAISAMQSFHEATEADSHLAMGYWGVALAAGGDLNIPIDDPCMKLAIAQTKLAIENAPSASPAERLYINAIRKRYGLDVSSEPEKRDPAQLSVPYMQDMETAWRQLFLDAKNPDPDVASLFAVSLMNLRPWLWWTTSGQQSDEIKRALDVLRRGLDEPQFKEHLGLNHFYIHAMEEAPVAAAVQAALSSADRLMRLAPERTPHLRHMPAHIYLLAGDWTDVVNANKRAVAADEWWKDQCSNGSGPHCNPLLVGHYRSHDLLFLGVGLSNQGVWKPVRIAAEATEANALPFLKNQPGLEHYLTTRVMMATHFGQWSYIRSIPPPQRPMPNPGAHDYCKRLARSLETAMWYFGQTMADAATGAPTTNGLYAFNMASGCASSGVGWGNNTANAILVVVHWRLLARIAQAEGKPDEAIEYARLSVETEDLLNYDEPPGWYISSREALGAALFRAGKFTEAQKVFEQDLALHRNNARSLFGRWQCLIRQRLPRPDIQKAERDFRAQWLNPALPSMEDM
ncbi:MAG: tetratricopeptide repeat protein [Acidobacteriaceae bacterium]